MNIRRELEVRVRIKNGIYINDVEIDPLQIKAIMINEVVPSYPSDDFYGGEKSDYQRAAISLFQAAGVHVSSMEDILDLGIYVTNAVKRPKSGYVVDKESLDESLQYLEAELSLFPSVKVIMLMGDVAKKAFNLIAKKKGGRNIIPSISTYKLRKSEIYYDGIRIIPSYIMTGGNILIEKSKVVMTSEDIATMLKIIRRI